jgi:hypothetical protein
MSLFKRNKKPNKAQVAISNVRTVPVPMMMHRFLLDSGIEEAQQFSTLLGLPPLENVEEEYEASTERLHDLAPLAPLLAIFSAVMSDSVTQYYLTMGKEDLDPREAEYMTDLFSRVTMATLRGSITQLRDMGLISYSYDKEEQ